MSMEAGRPDELNNDETMPCVAFIESDDTKYHTRDPALVERCLAALPTSGSYVMRLGRLGAHTDAGFGIIGKYRAETFVSTVREALSLNVGIAAKFLSDVGGKWRCIYRMERQGVAGFGTVLILYAPPPSSPVWEELKPDIVKYANAIQELCDSYGDDVHIINAGFTSAVLCRNGAVCAVVDPAISDVASADIRSRDGVQIETVSDHASVISVCHKLGLLCTKRKESEEGGSDEAVEPPVKKAKQ